MKRIVMLALTLPVFLVGCGGAVENGGADLGRDISGNAVKVVIDGTTCIVYDGNSSGAISCDWDYNEGTASELD